MIKTAPAQPGRRIPTLLVVLVGAVTTGAAVLLALTAGGIGAAVGEHPGAFAILVGLTLALQALSMVGFASSISVAGIGMLTAGFVLGTGPAVAVAIVASLTHALKRHPRRYKVLFNTCGFALATAAGTGTYQALDGPAADDLRQILASLLAAAAFVSVNIGLLTLAMAAAERHNPLRLWRERLAWLTPHYLAFGPLALAATLVYEDLGAPGLVAAAPLPVLMIILVRESLKRTRARHAVQSP